MPLKSLLRRRSKNRRESKVVPHAVDECEILSKPFPQLETRITSPTELINLVGHPDLSKITNTTISQRPALLKTTSTANTEQFHDYLEQHRTGVIPRQHRTITFDTTTNNNTCNNNLNTMANSYNNNHLYIPTINNPNSIKSNTTTTAISTSTTTSTNTVPQKSIDNDKTLVGQRPQSQPQYHHHHHQPSQSFTIATYSEYTDHKVYNNRFKQRSSPCLKQQYDQDQTNVEIQELRQQIELLETERHFWQQRLHDQQKRENELMHLLETTIDKLNQQLSTSSSFASLNDSTKFHHHHHYIHETSPGSLKRKNSSLRRTRSMDRPPLSSIQNKSITNIIQHNHQPIYEDYILPPWPPFVYL